MEQEGDDDAGDEAPGQAALERAVPRGLVRLVDLAALALDALPPDFADDFAGAPVPSFLARASAAEISTSFPSSSSTTSA